jgi:hypothetical protein
MAGEAFNSFLEERSRGEVLAGADRATEDKYQWDTSHKKLDQGKCFTAGLWSTTGNHCIDIEAMAIIRKGRARQKHKELDKKQKGEKKSKLLTQVRAIISNETQGVDMSKSTNNVFVLQTQDRQIIA